MQSFGVQGIFDNEDALREDYTPDELPEREEELERIHNALAPASRGSTAHNIFLYGKTGQGKTVAARKKTRQLESWSAEEGDIDISVVWQSCNNITSSYALATTLVEKLAGDNPNGHSQEQVFAQLYEEVEEIGGSVIFVLDEIDNLGTSDDVLYALPRARSEGHLRDARVSVIGISNDFNYVSNLSPKVKGTLCEKEVEFAPYKADALRSILQRRVDVAFEDDVVQGGVVPLCAALAAREEGSARQAIRLLYEAGELALTATDEAVTEDHVKRAHDVLSRERVVEGLRNVTLHDRMAITAVTHLECTEETPARTKHIYEQYRTICDGVELDPLRQRSLRDHLQELAMQGILEATHRTSGLQGGDYYEFELNTDLGMTVDVLAENARLSEAGIADSLRMLYESR